MSTVSAYAATSPTEPLSQTTIERRDVGPHDVAFDIHFAGICHSDIHTVRGEWGRAKYPIVPGHEIAGIVTEVGSEVTKFTVGDRVGVGCFVDSCRECEFCLAGEEQYCDNPGMIGTYNAVGRDGQPTQGGYSGAIVVDENYVLSIPDAIGLDSAAPLLSYRLGGELMLGLVAVAGHRCRAGQQSPRDVAFPWCDRLDMVGALLGDLGLQATDDVVGRPVGGGGFHAAGAVKGVGKDLRKRGLAGSRRSGKHDMATEQP